MKSRSFPRILFERFAVALAVSLPLVVAGVVHAVLLTLGSALVLTSLP